MYEHIHTDLAPVQADIDRLRETKVLPVLSAFVDGRGLNCPMPLLKTKLALKGLENGTVYTVATDPNSAQDLSQFCQKQGLALVHWHSLPVHPASDVSGQQLDTIFHFLITKNL